MTDIAVFGARGYAGRELLRLLLNHPGVDNIRAISSSAAGSRLSEHVPALAHSALELEGPHAVQQADVVMLATSDEVARHALTEIEDDQVVIDLSRAHRQDAIAQGGPWHYGWADLDAPPKGTMRIANPGCYPTSAMLGLAPIVQEGLAAAGPIVVDGKSGVSGAGATPRADLQFAEANESVRAYKVDGHDHGVEIRSAVHRLQKQQAAVRFTPHLVPQTRGLLTTSYVPAATDMDDVALAEHARRFYKDSPFVHVVNEPDTAHVRASNHAHLALHHDQDAGLIVARCAIDNLQKGAAGTAVQNLNAAMGWDITTGLEAVAA